MIQKQASKQTNKQTNRDLSSPWNCWELEEGERIMHSIPSSANIGWKSAQGERAQP